MCLYLFIYLFTYPLLQLHLHDSETFPDESPLALQDRMVVGN